MDELLAYFKTITLPTKPVKVNAYATIGENGGQNFIDSCERMVDRGDDLGLTFLRDYKATIERINEQTATDEH